MCGIFDFFAAKLIKNPVFLRQMIENLFLRGAK